MDADLTAHDVDLARQLGVLASWLLHGSCPTRCFSRLHSDLLAQVNANHPHAVALRDFLLDCGPALGRNMRSAYGTPSDFGMRLCPHCRFTNDCSCGKSCVYRIVHTRDNNTGECRVITMFLSEGPAKPDGTKAFIVELNEIRC